MNTIEEPRKRFSELDVIRYLIPSLIFLAMEKQWRVMEAVNDLFTSDICDFVGAFLLVFALFKKLRLSCFAMLIVAMLMLLLNTAIHPVQVESYLASFLGRFLYLSCLYAMAGELTGKSPPEAFCRHHDVLSDPVDHHRLDGRADGCV